MTAKSRKQPVFDLTSVTGLLRGQLTDAMAATKVPISLGVLADLLAEIDRLRSILDVQQEEANKDKIVPLVPKELDESSPTNYHFEDDRP